MAFGIDDVAIIASELAETTEAVEGVSEELVSEEFGEEAFNEGINHKTSEASLSENFVKFSADTREAIEAEFSPEKFVGLGIDNISDFFYSETAIVEDDASIQQMDIVEESKEIIQIKTINSGLEGQAHPVTGVEFERKVVTNEVGESIEGVFPQFESTFDAQLPEGMELSTDAEQFNECNRQLKEKFDSDPEFREQFNERQKDDIETGITPYGYTWHHNEEIGKMQLVEYDSHQKTAHTGGRSIWGGGSDFR